MKKFYELEESIYLIKSDYRIVDLISKLIEFEIEGFTHISIKESKDTVKIKPFEHSNKTLQEKYEELNESLLILESERAILNSKLDNNYLYQDVLEKELQELKKTK
tara:strand:- start:211 stop:528 length:318 start_codon:yes stop_codon:yes gene_type:complete